MQQLTKNKRGLGFRQNLIRHHNRLPGLSQYELTKKLKWNSGHVDGAIRRLVNQNLIVIKGFERNGRIVNLIYPKDSKPADLIEVPINLLQLENGQWQDCAFVYALDSTTIGITGTKPRMERIRELHRNNSDKEKQSNNSHAHTRQIQQILQNRKKTQNHLPNQQRSTHNNLRKPHPRKKIPRLNPTIIIYPSVGFLPNTDLPL